MNRITLLFALVLTGGPPCFADIVAVQSKLQSALVETDEARLRLTDLLASSADDIESASHEQARAVLPIAQKCLRSPLKTVRGYGLAVFYLTSFRTDSSELIESYVDDVAPFLDSQDLAVKRSAIVIFGTMQPHVLPRALELLATHLTDQDNTEMESGMIAATLIHECPADSKTIHRVLDFVSSHPDLKLRVKMIQPLGLNNVTDDEAIKYVRGGLLDQSSEVRRVSVEAVGHMRPEGRAKFRDDLLRLLANPDETPEARAGAQRVLQQ